jgi:hypothetical protein
LNLETCSEQELFTVLDEYRERCSVAYYLLKGDGCQNGVEVPEPERLGGEGRASASAST